MEYHRYPKPVHEPMRILHGYPDEIHHEMEHLFQLEDGALWVQSTAEVAEDPESRRIEVFFRAVNVDALHHQSAVLEALAQRDYDAVLSVDADSGLCRLYGSAPLPAGTTYRALTARWVRRMEAGPLRARLRRALIRKNVASN